MLRGVSAETFNGFRERSRIGLLLRAKPVHNANSGSHWTSSLLFSLSQELSVLWDMGADAFDTERAAAIIDRYNQFVSRVEELNLEAIDDKPILNGKEIVSILGSSRPGPWTGTVLAQVSEWALDNPQGTKEECIFWLKEEHAAGRVTADDPGSAKVPPAKKSRTEK